MAAEEKNKMEECILGPAESERLSTLIERQRHGLILEEEWAELDKLVAAYGRELHEQRLRELAKKRSVPLEQVRLETDAQFAEAVRQWQEIEPDLTRWQDQILADGVSAQGAR